MMAVDDEIVLTSFVVVAPRAPLVVVFLVPLRLADIVPSLFVAPRLPSLSLPPLHA